MKMRKAAVAGVLGFGLLAGCMTEDQAAYVRQLNQDYVKVINNGERVSTITQTFLGGAKVDFDIFKYDNAIWRCRHDGGGECHRQ
jgi:hypothetical protein